MDKKFLPRDQAGTKNWRSPGSRAGSRAEISTPCRDPDTNFSPAQTSDRHGCAAGAVENCLRYSDPQKGCGEEPSNYRPISLICIGLPCKMLEHIFLHYLNKTLDSILYNQQHGFRKGLECETQLCTTYQDLAKSIEKGSTVHGKHLIYPCKRFGALMA